MNNDPFSDLIRVISARAVASGALLAGGGWALEIPPPNGIKFWGVARGGCWVKIHDIEPFWLESGELLLLKAQVPLTIASDLGASRTTLDDLISRRVGAVSHLGTGDDFFMVGGNVELDPIGADVLLDALPPYLHLGPQAAGMMSTRWILEQLVQEREEDRPGSGVACAHLAQLMFIQILRAYLESTPDVATGLLKAASDRRLQPALRLIHQDPHRSWQVEELASAAAMSRAAFSAYFKQVAGVAPIGYLTAWRMRLAKKALLEEKIPLIELAARSGYASESAFSNAFKRVTGLAPRRYRESMADFN